MRHLPLLLMLTLSTGLAITFASPSEAQAKCKRTTSTISVHPNPSELLPTLPTLMIEATGEVSGIVTQANMLESLEFAFTVGDKMSTTPATLISSHKGILERRSILVQPSSALPDGVSVTLRYTYNKKIRKLGTWTVSKDAEHAPEAFGALTAKDKAYVRYGCGPSAQITVALESPMAHTGIVLANVVDSTGYTQSYPMLVAAGSGEIKLGRTMCGGRFNFSPSGFYEITLTGFDTSGTPILLHDNALITKGPTPD